MLGSSAGATPPTWLTLWGPAQVSHSPDLLNGSQSTYAAAKLILSEQGATYTWDALTRFMSSCHNSQLFQPSFPSTRGSFPVPGWHTADQGISCISPASGAGAAGIDSISYSGHSFRVSAAKQSGYCDSDPGQVEIVRMPHLHLQISS